MKLLSVDVEDYYHVESFSDVIPRTQWEQHSSRVEANTQRLLDLFDESGARGTFFILGWVAERHPRLVREIASRGHEVGCHSYWHRLIFRLDQAEFEADTRRSKDVIEQAAGCAVHGYRAPSYSITTRSLWAFESLIAAGFTYDSSVFPIHHDVYGIPDAPRQPFRVITPSGTLLEFPLTTFRLGGAHNFPVGGGGYLRILPLWYTRLGFARASAQGVPLIVNVHPWEIDPEQPRLAGRRLSRLRHYTNLARTSDKLRRVLRDGDFSGFGAHARTETRRDIDLRTWMMNATR
ncbi:MAG: DUF3473 domain-containing protein [Gemmatimonadota bacterium]|nr:DUF3473 domain-containing protein [Gemmatimonadota bacterium]